MPKKPVRDAAYYESLLKRKYPEFYTELKAGKYRTVTDAVIAAGIKKTRTRLQEMKNAWSKSSPSEKHDFLNWLRADIKSKLPPPVALMPSLPITIDRKLIPIAAARIREIINKRHLKMGDVMDEMGFLRLNASLGMALFRGTRLQPELISQLEIWLATNASV